MENTKIIIDYENNSISEEELLINPEKYNITEITLAQDEIFKINQFIIKKIRTDYNHPLRLDEKYFNEGTKLSINPEYFTKNPQVVHNIINQVAAKTTNSHLAISKKELITKTFFSIALNNKNITQISLTQSEINNESKFVLTKELYDIVKSSQTKPQIITPAIAPELEDNYDEIIGYNFQKKLINYHTYSDIKNETNKLHITNPLTPEEINNLKYLPTSKEISISLPNTKENYKNLENILDKLLELGLTPNIDISVKDKELFNKTNIYKNTKYSLLNINITQHDGSPRLSLKNYKNIEETMYLFLKPALERNYSPFEKLVYAYNISKKFKEYKENPKNLNESRYLSEILFNEYMVCVGYSKMFTDLLKKLEIESKTISIDVAINKEGEPLKTAGHARVLYHLKDPKYNIDGYYTADPTWDNNLQEDLYNYIALTAKETNRLGLKQKSGIYHNKYSNSLYINPEDLILSSSLKEFYNKINYIINKKMELYIKQCKTKKAIYKSKEEISKIYIDLLGKILNELKEIDIKKYKEIITKYSPSATEENIFLNINQNFSKIIEELGNYFNKKLC